MQCLPSLQNCILFIFFLSSCLINFTADIFISRNIYYFDCSGSFNKGSGSTRECSEMTNSFGTLIRRSIAILYHFDWQFESHITLFLQSEYFNFKALQVCVGV